MTDNHESPDMMLTADKTDPIEKIDPAEPTPPMESTEPIEPTDKTELLEPMDRTESRDQSDHREPLSRRFTESLLTLIILWPDCPSSPVRSGASRRKRRGPRHTGHMTQMIRVAESR